MPGPVLYVTRILPTYRVSVLDALNEALEDRLVVAYGQPPEGSSLESLVDEGSGSFERFELPNYWFRGQTAHFQRYGPLFDAYDNPSVLLAEESPRSVSLPFLLRRAGKLGAARVLWGHFTSNDRRFSRWHPFDRYRLELARRVEACVCYSNPIRETLAEHLESDRLFVARNTADVDELLDLRDQLDRLGKERIRAELGLATDAPVLVFLGRLIPRKRPDRLVKVFQSIRGKTRAQLVIIGDGPEMSRLREMVREARLPDVTFTGAITDRKTLGRHLYASDIMVIPGYLGLAVNDAFSFGLPVVSVRASGDERYHSPEIAYIQEGENGLLAPPDDPHQMVDAIDRILGDLDTYAENALNYARNHLTTGQMVEGLVEAIRYAESNRTPRIRR